MRITLTLMWIALSSLLIALTSLLDILRVIRVLQSSLIAWLLVFKRPFRVIIFFFLPFEIKMISFTHLFLQIKDYWRFLVFRLGSSLNRVSVLKLLEDVYRVFLLGTVDVFLRLLQFDLFKLVVIPHHN